MNTVDTVPSPTCDGDTTIDSGTARLVAATNIADAFYTPCVAGTTWSANGATCAAVTVCGLLAGTFPYSVIEVAGSSPNSPYVYDGTYELKTGFTPEENYLQSTTQLYDGKYVFFVKKPMEGANAGWRFSTGSIDNSKSYWIEKTGPKSKMKEQF